MYNVLILSIVSNYIFSIVIKKLNKHNYKIDKKTYNIIYNKYNKTYTKINLIAYFIYAFSSH
jgi:hypothetical protein